ncbi:uncharacterized protein LOC120354540 [Nilaparvata lugens]|uniref:uncharacterized protein LOC120354540 n=1 Tax=Nilaparvata lugens TaxID=108931 RepID=UPI00193CEE0D|nr:uncharacterized protein LOC120354540 [Nilaparvata lugens]
MDCSVCDKALPIDNDCVACGKCQLEYHFHCSGVSKSTWKAKSAQKKAEWECPQCRGAARPRKNSTEEELTDGTHLMLKRLVEKMLSDHEAVMVKKMEEMKKLFTGIEEKIGGVLEEIKNLKKKTEILKSDIDDLRVDLECERQYGRSRNIIISSIPFSRNEDLKEKILTLMKKMDIELRREDITTHRLPSKNAESPTILQLSSRSVRDMIVKKARAIRPTTSMFNETKTLVSCSKPPKCKRQ